MDFDQAAQAHRDWKVKFRMAITNKTQMDAASIGSDKCCEFGKWLHGDAKQRLGRMKSYSECINKHANFHKEAGKVAQAINARQYAEAGAMLDATPYAAASSAVGSALLALRKEAAL